MQIGSKRPQFRKEKFNSQKKGTLDTLRLLSKKRIGFTGARNYKSSAGSHKSYYSKGINLANRVHKFSKKSSLKEMNQNKPDTFASQIIPNLNLQVTKSADLGKSNYHNQHRRGNSNKILIKEGQIFTSEFFEGGQKTKRKLIKSKL